MIEGTMMGLILGKIRGGNLENLSVLSIRGWPIAIVAFLFHIGLIFLHENSFIVKYGGYVFGGVLVLVLLVLIFNLDKKWVWLLLLGVIINLAAISLNAGKMPISFEGLSGAGKDLVIEKIKKGDTLQYISLDKAKGFTKYISKGITLPKPYPLAKVMSIGDVLISIGLCLFIQSGMIKNKYGYERSRMINFQYKSRS